MRAWVGCGTKLGCFQRERGPRTIDRRYIVATIACIPALFLCAQAFLRRLFVAKDPAELDLVDVWHLTHDARQRWYYWPVPQGSVAEDTAIRVCIAIKCNGPIGHVPRFSAPAVAMSVAIATLVSSQGLRLPGRLARPRQVCYWPG